MLIAKNKVETCPDWEVQNLSAWNKNHESCPLFTVSIKGFLIFYKRKSILWETPNMNKRSVFST